jgi:UDPglucose 6-dehydrogenase
MTKYAANSYLATRISFMNEIANLCDKLGADVDMVRRGMGSDSRIGKRFLFPGVGYGGSCFPKDVKALYKTAMANEYDFKILDSVMSVNKIQKQILVEKIKDFYDGDVKDKTIAIWGLAFKPETDDIREAPALEIIQLLLNHGVNIKVFDPEAMENVKALFGEKLTYADNQYEALQNADALAIVTEWAAFRNPNFDKIKSTIKSPIIFDGRNLYNTERMEELGFHYESIGRKKIKLNK